MTLDDVICRIECEELIYRAARYLDEGALNEHLSLYTPDAKLDFGVGPEIGLKDWAEMIKTDEVGNRLAAVALKPRVVSNLLITRTAPETVTARAYVTLPDASHGSSRGEWTYELRKTNKGWLISRYKVAGIPASTLQA